MVASDCLWGMLAVFLHTRGVLYAVSGYVGDQKEAHSGKFYKGASQQRVALGYIAQRDAAKVLPQKIVTQLAPLTAFYLVEA